MSDLLKDIDSLKAGLVEGRDLAELNFDSPEVSALAGALAKRDSRERRRIRAAGASLNKVRIEKDQYKSSLSELQKILDLCRVIASSQDLKDILHHLVFLLSEILPSRGCAVFVGDGGFASPGTAPLFASNFTPQLQQILAQHYEEGIIRWILQEKRVCLIPSFEDRPGEGGGDFAVIPLHDNDRNHGFVWIACTLKQEEVTAETVNLIWVLSSQASIAIMNCLHRERMEEKLNELKLLTSINALGHGREDGMEAAGALRAFFREFQKLIARELRLDQGFLLFPDDAASADNDPRPPPIDGAPFLEHAETRKLLRLAEGEHLRLEAGDFFLTAYPRMAKALASHGLAILSLSPDAGRGAFLLIRLSAEETQRMPALQNLLQAVASQARVVAENIDLYDSLLAANRNLTAMQWQLVHSGKMAAVGQLAGGVAHEINNPLQIMLGRIQMIQIMAGDDKTAADPGKIKEELRLVTDEVLRIRDIVRNLLDFSRQGKREAALTPLSLDDAIKDVLALLRHQLISNQVEVRLSLGGTQGSYVLGNRNQLKQVFINLMMNAIHAMEKEPRVLEIATAERDGMVVATVRDSGVGIAREDQERIFEPFFSTKPMGTGLGLSISYGLIKDHKGTIEVESQQGRGTCFTIRIPRVSDQARGYNLLVG
ncbi:MAG: GAF domain-containing protein [Fibrobacteres bacterium]|nr:GAF domain-containing protein [Fibrobacterota bacterium]